VKIIDFWDVRPYSLLESYCFEENRGIHLYTMEPAVPSDTLVTICQTDSNNLQSHCLRNLKLRIFTKESLFLNKIKKQTNASENSVPQNLQYLNKDFKSNNSQFWLMPIAYPFFLLFSFSGFFYNAVQSVWVQSVTVTNRFLFDSAWSTEQHTDHSHTSCNDTYTDFFIWHKQQHFLH
jgi:hypothetical protein